jgi:hypothetical protein
MMSPMRCVWWGIALAVAGCATGDQSAYLRWKEGPPSGRLDGKVAVKLVPNLRPAQHGDSDLSDIGRERTPQGQTVGIKLAGEQNPRLDYTVGKMTMAALRTAGLGITQPEDPKATAHLTIEIHDFWCDGLIAARASVGLELVLIDPASGAERLRVPVNATGTAAQCREAFRIALGPPTSAPPGGEQPQPH